MPKRDVKQYQKWATNPVDVGTLLFDLQKQIDALKSRPDAKAILNSVGSVLKNERTRFDEKLVGLDGSDLYRTVTLALFDQKLAEMRNLVTAQKFEKAVQK